MDWRGPTALAALSLVLLAAAGIARCTSFDWERERACQRVGGVTGHPNASGRGCFKVTVEPLQTKE